jgi:hypothetical protein
MESTTQHALDLARLAAAATANIQYSPPCTEAPSTRRSNLFGSLPEIWQATTRWADLA